jgi:hypothetical protein
MAVQIVLAEGLHGPRDGFFDGRLDGMLNSDIDTTFDVFLERRIDGRTYSPVRACRGVIGLPVIRVF